MRFFIRQVSLVLFLFSGFRGYCATIKGHVYDKTTREQLVGAYVTVKSDGKGCVTELDGSFNLKDLVPGNYVITVSYVGYVSRDTGLTITDNNQTIKLEINLNPEAHAIGEVEIKSKAYGGSDEFALRSEQKSISLMNILSANAIQISPDITVANVMQRISGVTMDKGSSGEARYAVIRGMDKRYNSTLVNNVKIPSPNDKDRYVPMDIFPAELIERLEVIKTLMPSMEGDATGGVVNMVMKNAPDKLMVEASVAGGYSDIFQNMDFQKFDWKGVSDKSPAEKLGQNVNAKVSDFPNKNLILSNLKSPLNTNSSLTIGNRYFKKKLGVILSMSDQNAYRGTNSSVLVQNATVAPSSSASDPLTRTFSDILVRKYSTLTKRAGFEGRADYKFNENNSISLFAFYAQLNEFRVRSTIDSLLGGYSMHDYVGIFKISDDFQTRQTKQSIYSVTVQGKHKLHKNVSADWSLVASQANRSTPDIADYSSYRGVNPNIAAQTFTIGAPVVDDQTRDWTHNSDKDLSGYLNFHYTPNFIPGLTKIDFGGLYRHKDRDNYYNKYTLKTLPDSGSADQLYHSVQTSKFFFSTNGGAGNSSQDGGTYTFGENILSYYLQLHEEIGNKIKLDGGFRIENTTQDYMTTLPVSQSGKSANYDYSDFLPSIQGKYELNTKSAVRASYFRSIFRPAFADLVPFIDPNANDIYTTQGNAFIQHTSVENFDLRYELFPKGLDQFLVGAFYKIINNPIEYTGLESGYGKDLIMTPGNYGTAYNSGLELVFRKYVGKFGISANYTYTNSEITSAKRLYWANAASGTHYDTISVKRPLQGQAPHIGNLSFLFKDTRRKVEAQLAFVYTGERLYALSPYDKLDNWEKPTFTLDLSAQKTIGKRFTVYFKANNLLNTPLELFIKEHNNAFSGTNKLPFQESANYVTVQKDSWYRTFLFGLRFKL